MRATGQDNVQVVEGERIPCTFSPGLRIPLPETIVVGASSCLARRVESRDLRNGRVGWRARWRAILLWVEVAGKVRLCEHRVRRERSTQSLRWNTLTCRKADNCKLRRTHPPQTNSPSAYPPFLSTTCRNVNLPGQRHELELAELEFEDPEDAGHGRFKTRRRCAIALLCGGARSEVSVSHRNLRKGRA